MTVHHGVMIALALCVFVSALGVVTTKHQSRQLFIELEALKAERDELNIEWGKLTLEQATLVTPTRVERLARDRLGMSLPPAERIVVVRP
jgi:cell division protein FtsL